MILLQLPYPHKALWPNGRAHWGAKAKQVKDHRTWAFMAAKAASPTCFQSNGERIPVRLIVSAKPKGPLPDKDNCLAAAKSYLDGIAEALGVNDNLFDPQPVHFSGRQSNFTIEVG
jgi:crossover junction endodeoxyribonuclease RusA